MVRGPGDFCPTIEMEIVSRRKAIPMDENEGIYIRNIKTGKVSVKFTMFTSFSFLVKYNFG